jgi:hypothetical protein
LKQSTLKNLFLTFSFCLSAYFTQAQSNHQTIRGTVVDKFSRFPITGVLVQLDSSTFYHVSDSLGSFSIGNVAPGRYNLKCSFIGYGDLVMPNIVVNSGKEVVLDIEMTEVYNPIGEVVIQSNNKSGTLNNLSSVSARTFSMEEVNRFAGGRSDVARLVANLAGVSTPDDSRNDIVIRGNSPVGVLWRIDGMNVTNPNHFASVGTTGGAVSALNTNLLKNSDFFTSAFPAEYGNATSGVFDIGFRNGNNKKRETTFQVGVVTGIEATTEGPFSKNSNASYLIGYRYSLAGMAQNLGVNIGTSATPTYQDLSFKINGSTTKVGKFSLFGILAKSTIEIGGGSQNTLYGNGNQVDFGSEIGILGISHFKQLNRKSYITSLVGLNYGSTDQTGYDFNFPTNETFIKEVNNVAKKSLNFSSAYHLKVNSKVFLKVGVQQEFISLDLFYKTKNRIEDSFDQIWDYNSNTSLTQAFAHLKFNPTEKITINAGVHAQMFFLNSSRSVEPRLGMVFNISKKSSLNLGYGLHAQMQPINVYFLQSTDALGNVNYSNKDLDFTKSHHFVVGYNIQPLTNWRVKAEAYYQSIFNVPVNTYSSSYAMLNTGSTFKADLQDSLVNAGTGENYGVELTVEKFFSKGFYALCTSSIYKSVYAGSDGVQRNTAFNGRYVFNFLAGKEWTVGKNRHNKFAVDCKFTNAGGRAFTSIDLDASNLLNREVLSGEAYDSYYSNYYRLDFKMGFTMNSNTRKQSQSISLDLQNVTNHKNVFSQSYDNRTQSISTTNQLGFFPNVVYKVQF